MFFAASPLAAAQKNKTRAPDQEDRCPAIDAKGVHVEFAKPENDSLPVLQVRFADGHSVKAALRAFDPSNGCRKLMYFPERSLVILDFFAGEAGTQIVTRMSFLKVYRISEKGMESIGDFTLERTEEVIAPLPSDPSQKPSGPHTTFRATYTLPRLVENHVVFEIKDELTGETSRHSY
jgi:hypothetical protein